MVRWFPLAPVNSANSQQSSREVMLRADNADDMKSWLLAIADECSRTAERPVVDWWSELFGEAGVF